jgi:hypothetical protein
MYLKNTNFLPESLAQVIKAAQPISNDRHAVHISRDAGEQFRSAFTERLAKVGFGADYEPTSEGKMLEELIDRFYST